MIFWLILPRNRILHFMLMVFIEDTIYMIVSIGGNLHSVTCQNLFSRENKNIFYILSAKIFTQHAKC